MWVWYCAGATVVLVVALIAWFEWSNSTSQLQSRVSKARRSMPERPPPLHALQALMEPLDRDQADEVAAIADGLVWRLAAGFDSTDDVVRLLGEALDDELGIAADPEILRGWAEIEAPAGRPSVMRTRLRAAFESLEAEGIAAREHWGWDRSDGRARLAAEGAVVAVFYTEQETRRAVHGLGMVLTLVAPPEQRERLVARVVEVLGEHEVPAEAIDGTVAVLPFRWTG